MKHATLANLTLFCFVFQINGMQTLVFLMKILGGALWVVTYLIILPFLIISISLEREWNFSSYSKHTEDFLLQELSRGKWHAMCTCCEEEKEFEAVMLWFSNTSQRFVKGLDFTVRYSRIISEYMLFLLFNRVSIGSLIKNIHFENYVTKKMRRLNSQCFWLWSLETARWC